MIGGKISKVTTNVTLTTNAIKKALKLALEGEEEKIERAHLKRR
jgi:DNA sulfur modification protein DndB